MGEQISCPEVHGSNSIGMRDMRISLGTGISAVQGSTIVGPYRQSFTKFLSQVTLDIALRWSAEIGRHHDSIDIALRWSARDGKSLK